MFQRALTTLNGEPWRQLPSVVSCNNSASWLFLLPVARAFPCQSAWICSADTAWYIYIFTMNYLLKVWPERPLSGVLSSSLDECKQPTLAKQAQMSTTLNFTFQLHSFRGCWNTSLFYWCFTPFSSYELCFHYMLALAWGNVFLLGPMTAQVQVIIDRSVDFVDIEESLIWSSVHVYTQIATLCWTWTIVCPSKLCAIE